MKSAIKNLLMLFLTALIFSSCGKSKKTADVLIPGNAALVFHINAASLSSKLSWNEIKNSDWFKMAVKEGPEDAFAKKMLDDPENSGIDLKNDMYFFIQMHGSDAYIVFQGKLKDAAGFETTVKKIAKHREIKKDGNLTFASDDEGCVSWNKDRFITVFNVPGFMGMRNRFGGRKRSEITEDSILNFAKQLYSLKKSNSLGNDSRFAALMDEKGDMHFWVNAGLLMQGSMPMGFGNMFKATSLIEGNVTGYTMSFDNGKITASTRSWYNKELGAFMKKFRPGNINTDMLKRISGQNVSVVFAMNYPPEGLKEFMKLLGVDGVVNGFMGEIGLSLDDFVKANKGDLLFAVSDFSVQDKTETYDFGGAEPYSYTTTKPDAKILFATSINDKTAFDKIVDIVKSEISKQGNQEESDQIKYAIKDNWFVAGNAQESVDGFAAGNKTDHAFISKISGHPMGGYIDIQKMLGGIQTKKTDNFKNVLSGSGNIWDNIVFYGGDMKDGASIGYFEINMIDKTTNSLKQFNNYISTMAKTARDTRNYDMSERDNRNYDSIYPLPPVRDTIKLSH
jgi:hypothetical protein